MVARFSLYIHWHTLATLAYIGIHWSCIPRRYKHIHDFPIFIVKYKLLRILFARPQWSHRQLTCSLQVLECHITPVFSPNAHFEVAYAAVSLFWRATGKFAQFTRTSTYITWRYDNERPQVASVKHRRSHRPRKNVLEQRLNFWKALKKKTLPQSNGHKFYSLVITQCFINMIHMKIDNASGNALKVLSTSIPGPRWP